MSGRPLRVLHCSAVWLALTKTWMFTQVRALPADIEAHVVCDRAENLEQFSVRNLHCLYAVSRARYLIEKGIRRLGRPRYRGFLRETARKLAPNILHSHFGPNGWLEMCVARQENMRHVVSFYGYDVVMLPSQSPKWARRYLELFEGADLFLCEGPHMAELLVQQGCVRKRIQIHHLGIDLSSFPFEPRQWRSDGPLRVLIAAGYREKKGIPYALDALARLQEILPVEITIIGDADAEVRGAQEKSRILETIRRNRLEAHVRLLGYQPARVLRQEAYSHHVFMAPSITAADGDVEGGAPVSLIEMIATGMPVVSTRHCDIPEVVQYGMHDWLAEERDVDGLVNRLRWLIEHAADWGRFLRLGRRHIETHYDAVQQGRRLAEIYRRLAYAE